MVPVDNDPSSSILYRQTPFMIQAAVAGNVEVIKALEAAGKSILGINYDFGNNFGHIGLSKKHQNSFCSNVLGASAYWGNHEALDYCLKKC